MISISITNYLDQFGAVPGLQTSHFWSATRNGEARYRSKKTMLHHDFQIFYFQIFEKFALFLRFEFLRKNRRLENRPIFIMVLLDAE